MLSQKQNSKKKKKKNQINDSKVPKTFQHKLSKA